MKAVFLSDEEARAEYEKSRKHQGQWIKGRWERLENGKLKWIRPKFIENAQVAHDD